MYFSFVTESNQTTTGNLIAYANVTAIMYTQSGVVTCGHEGQEDTKSINITVKCGMINHLSITLEIIFAIIDLIIGSMCRKPYELIISEKTSHCPSKPSNLTCLSNMECNRCIHAEPNTAAHEECSLYSSTPVCDMDSAINATGIQDTADLGFRKLSVCSGCNKDCK